MRPLTLAVLLLIFLVITPEALAAKPRLRRQKAVGASCKLAVATVQKSPATHSVVATFTNLDKVKTIWYSLSYRASGTLQAVAGSLTPKGQTTDQRDFYLGTCSGSVCTPHFPKTAALSLTATDQSGCTWRSRYNIRF